MGAKEASVDTTEDNPKENGSSDVSPSADTSILQPLPSTSGFLPKPVQEGGDSLAANEAQLFANGKNLDVEAKVNEHTHHQNFRKWLHLAATIIFMAVMAIILWGMVTYAWHMLMPEKWHYLTEKQLETVSRLLATALFSSALTGYINKRMT